MWTSWDGEEPSLSSDPLSWFLFSFGSLKLAVLAEGFLGPSLGAHSACVNGWNEEWSLPCMQMILGLPLWSSWLVAVSGTFSRGVSCQDSVDAMGIRMDP